VFHGSKQGEDFWAAPFQKQAKLWANLLRKHIIHDATCLRCLSSTEDADHMVLHYETATTVWALLDILPPPTIQDIWMMRTHPDLDVSIWPSVALTILWKIWDSRNVMVFHNESYSSDVTVGNIVSDFTIWSHRFKVPSQKEGDMSWRSYLSSRIGATM
jgi:hypothetical protein